MLIVDQSKLHQTTTELNVWKLFDIDAPKFKFYDLIIKPFDRPEMVM